MELTLGYEHQVPGYEHYTCNNNILKIYHLLVTTKQAIEVFV